MGNKFDDNYTQKELRKEIYKSHQNKLTKLAVFLRIKSVRYAGEKHYYKLSNKPVIRLYNSRLNMLNPLTWIWFITGGLLIVITVFIYEFAMFIISFLQSIYNQRRIFTNTEEVRSLDKLNIK